MIQGPQFPACLCLYPPFVLAFLQTPKKCRRESLDLITASLTAPPPRLELTPFLKRRKTSIESERVDVFAARHHPDDAVQREVKITEREVLSRAQSGDSGIDGIVAGDSRNYLFSVKAAEEHWQGLRVRYCQEKGKVTTSRNVPCSVTGFIAAILNMSLGIV